MASENTYSSMSDLRTQEELAGFLGMLLADRNALPNHPAIMNAGSINGRSSNVIKVPFVGLNGKNRFAAVSQLNPIGNTQIADASVTLTPGRYGLAHAFEDLAKITDAQGIINPQRMAESMMADWMMTQTDAIAGLADNFTSQVGSVSVDMDIETLLTGKGTLEDQYASGDFLAILKPAAWNKLEIELSTVAGGSLKYDPATPDLIKVLGNGYKGRLNGMAIFSSPAIPASSTGYCSCIISYTAVLIGTATPPAYENDPFSALMPPLRVMWAPERGTGQQRFIAETYFAASIGQDGAGVGLLHT